MQHPLKCRCGSVEGFVSAPERANRAICYCKDCQAFAHFVGRAGEILDNQGGTDILQTTPSRVTINRGHEKLACIRLTDKGMLRWYTTCCSTPIGNTLANYKFSFVGLIHTCLENSDKSVDASFGPVKMRVNTQSAKGTVQARPIATFGRMLGIFGMLARAYISGGYRRTPFFAAPSGAPIAVPKILSATERQALANAQ
jgi:hypothetical protein